jgi:hypothetical protein
MVTLQAQGDAAEDTGVAGITLFEGGRHDAQIVRLIHAEHHDKLPGPVGCRQFLNFFLLRKSSGAGRRSDEAGRRLVYNFGASRFNAFSYG